MTACSRVVSERVPIAAGDCQGRVHLPVGGGEGGGVG